jgi:hypothetical protein
MSRSAFQRREDAVALGNEMRVAVEHGWVDEE